MSEPRFGETTERSNFLGKTNLDELSGEKIFGLIKKLEQKERLAQHDLALTMSHAFHRDPDRGGAGSSVSRMEDLLRTYGVDMPMSTVMRYVNYYDLLRGLNSQQEATARQLGISKVVQARRHLEDKRNDAGAILETIRETRTEDVPIKLDSAGFLTKQPRQTRGSGNTLAAEMNAIKVIRQSVDGMLGNGTIYIPRMHSKTGAEEKELRDIFREIGDLTKQDRDTILFDMAQRHLIAVRATFAIAAE